MSVLLRPDGLPSTRRKVPLTRVDVKTVVEFERWCQMMGLHLDLYCDKCTDTHGPAGSRCWGNNTRDASAYHLECQCTDRIYGQDTGTREVPRIVGPHDNKPTIIVP